MEILLLLLPLSVVLVFVIGAAFWWSVGSGQFDDLESPAYRVLADEDRIEPLDPDQSSAAGHGHS
ncbi:MAG TPA: cbb3-type cytochrome oxidase assembly protein CcoS [Casimicrobiaceae bacterium]|jgi:cbb3-type cytochrome oxidase maturation protein|nr:cbb3-type cytochrome oxidase assembly protein CcoS [Casimicrobiaceae bacterium]